MNCDEARPLLDACLDGELDLVHTVAVEQHLAQCRVCREQQARTRAVTALLRARLPQPVAPPELRARLGREPASSPPLPGPWRQPAWWIGLAAALLLGWFLRAAWPVGRPEHLPALLAEVLQAHGRAVTQATVFSVRSEDRHTVKPWLAQRLAFAAPVRDLAAAGFPLLGARLDFLQGQPQAVLIYGRRKHQLEVFLAPESAAGPAQWASRDGLQLARWSRDGFRFLIVSDLPETELREFAAAWEKPESEAR